jgi:UDPglucose 6-dehydrogenase
MKVVIIGSGVVGQATGKGFKKRGHEVRFVDVRKETVENLKKEGHEAYLWEDLSGKSINDDVVVFTVSTPTEKGKINLGYLEKAAEEVGKRMAEVDNYQVVVVRSTVLPGTTEGLVARIVEEYSGRKMGRDFGVVMNPEYLREVSAVDDFDKPWLVTIGQLDEKSGDVVAKLYGGFDCGVERVSVKEAETQKYVHNLYNAVKITFFNEMRGVCDQIGAEADKILR